MRLLLATAAVAFAIASPTLAKGNPQMKVCATQWKAAPHAGTTHKAFMASCLSSAPAAAPAPMANAAPAATRAPPAAAAAPAMAAGSAPAGATAKCKDGTFSMSKHHSGSCSRHGGVAAFL